MIRNKLFYLLILIFLFSFSYKKKYNKNDISEIIEVALHEISRDNRFKSSKISVEFETIHDEASVREYLEINFLDRPMLHPYFGGSLEDKISKADIDYMLENIKRLEKKQKKVTDYITSTDYITCTDDYIARVFNFSDSETVEWHKENIYAEKIYLPYISINHDLAMIHHNLYSIGSIVRSMVLLKKIKGNWRVIGYS